MRPSPARADCAATVGSSSRQTDRGVSYRMAGFDSRPTPIGFPNTARDFARLTDAFVADPVLNTLLPLLRKISAGIEKASEWMVHVHPIRVEGSADSRGDATPEGRHQDGVTLVSSLLIARRNATGGQSSVSGPDGQEVLTATLSEPGALLVADDRRTWHSVSPIQPLNMAAPAHRDVLVVTLTAAE
jgi:hypothetical protein